MSKIYCQKRRLKIGALYQWVQLCLVLCISFAMSSCMQTKADAPDSNVLAEARDSAFLEESLEGIRLLEELGLE